MLAQLFSTSLFVKRLMIHVTALGNEKRYSNTTMTIKTVSKTNLLEFRFL